MDEALDRARKAEGEVDVLRTALRTALFSNDYYAIEGAKRVLKNSTSYDTSPLYDEYITVLSRAEALKKENEELQEYKWMYEGLQ